jgi:DME family drug/metabolite transporter
MTDPAPRHDGFSHIAGYLFALGAGAVWGTTGPLSTALYAEGYEIWGIGFWRVLIGTIGLAAYALATRRGFARLDRRAVLVVGVGGGLLVAVFELAYQFGIAGTGVAGAAALLYIAPVLVALLARPILGERITGLRVLLAVAVMAGAAMTVLGGSHATGATAGPATLAAGVAGGLLAAASYAATTLLARWAVPRYGTFNVLFLEIAGGTVLLGILLVVIGRPPAPPATIYGWMFIVALAAGAVLLANVFFFAAVRRIEAAPTAVAATIEPVVGTLLALVLFAQHLSLLGVIGLTLVVSGVATGYWKEGTEDR